MPIGVEKGICKLSANSSLVFCILFYTNAHVKDMNSSFSTSYGLNNKVEQALALDGSYSKRRKTLNSKQQGK